jgi:hypothetical protein
MRLLSKILWFLAFLVATFCWMVLFEHGFSVNSFTQGVKQELADWKAKVTGSAEAKPATPAAAEAAAPKTPPPTEKKPGT